jgi:glycosyltransferase involved in cell wall biosynthesis
VEKRRLKISMIGPFGLRQKGTSRARLLPLARALAERGHQIKLVLPPWDSPQDSGQEVEAGGVAITHVTLPPSFPGLFHILLARRLATAALAFRPNVVHCFKPKAYAGMAAFFLWYAGRLGLAKARLVLDTDDWEGPGGWNEIAPYSTMQKALFAFQERWGLVHCHALTVASQALQTIAWSRGVPRDRVFYLPNGWGAKDPKPEVEASSPVEGRVALLFTRFVEFDVPWLVDMWKDVLARVPEARLLVIGKGFFGEEDSLQRLADSEGLGKSMEYLGWLEGDELRRRQQATHLAILPYQDTLINRTKCSVKLIELMASGLPVVATDVGENSHYIEHGVSGWLVPPDDNEAFANAVALLLKDLQLRTRLGKGARQRILDEFKWSNLAERAEQAYLRALQ